MIECIGIQEKKGSFENDKGKTIEYDNVMLYFVTNENRNTNGYYCEELKISRSKVQMVGFSDWTEVIGKQIRFEYDMFGAKPTLSGVSISGEGKLAEFIGHMGNTGKK